MIRINALQLAIYFNLGLYYENKNEFGDAYKYYKLIIKDNPNFVEGYIKLGELARLRGHKAKAIEYMKLAVEKHFAKPKQAENLTNPNNDSNNSNVNETKVSSGQRLIPIMTKPINPLLVMAQIHSENGQDNEALDLLINILRNYDDKDCYTLVYVGNIYYELAVQIRNTKHQDFCNRLNKALEYYFQALELDKYNAFAAIGVCNIYSEYNLLTHSLETYKNIAEKMPSNNNSFINEAMVYMNEGKFDKASIILTKLIKRFFKNKFPEIENLLAKSLLQMRSFNKAFDTLKSLIFRYPDNLYYKFNYALCLRAKSEDIISKTERKVRETAEAVQNLEKAIPIFTSLLRIKKEVKDNFKNEKEEKFMRSSEFIFQIKDVLELSKISLMNAKVFLETDRQREQEILSKIEENRQRLTTLMVSIYLKSSTTKKRWMRDRRKR